MPLRCPDRTHTTSPDWDTPDQEAVRRLVDDFPFEMPLLVDLGATRVLCSPRISELLSANGKYLRNGQVRHSNLSEAVVGLLRIGYASPMGRRILAEVARIHEPLCIPHQDMWYSLAMLAFQPMGWIEKYGWRSLEPLEKDSLLQFWREVGIRLHLPEAPADARAMEEFLYDYERTHFALAPQNEQMAQVAQREWLTPFPRGTRWFARLIFLSVLDDRIRQALGLPHPRRSTTRAISQFFLFRRRVLKMFPPLRRSWWAGGWAVHRSKVNPSDRFLHSIAGA